MRPNRPNRPRIAPEFSSDLLSILKGGSKDATFLCLAIPFSANADLIIAWERNSHGQVFGTPTSPGYTAIAAGHVHGLARCGRHPPSVIKGDHAARDLATAHFVERFVYLFQLDSSGNQIVQMQFAFEVELHKAGHIHPEVI